MIKRIPEIFTQSFPHWKKIEFFRTVLYALLLFNALTLLPIAEQIFGYSGIVGTRGWNTSYPWYAQGSKVLLNVLSHPANSSHTWVYQFFVYGQIVFLLLGLFRVFPRIAAVAIYFFTVNLFHKGYLMFTGGEVLVNVLLFYMMFIQRSDPRSKNNEQVHFSPLQNVINNVFYWIVLIQVCVLYFFSTVYKLLDEHWVSGDALMYISRVDVFSGDSMRLLFSENPMLSKTATYIALAYQGLFPLLVWFKRVKIPFLMLGVVLHLAIAFGMGIFTFGIIMIITYILFLDISQIEKVKNRLFFWKKATA